MCESVTIDEQVGVAEILALCDDAVDHVLDYLGDSREDSLGGVGLLEAFCATAKTLVIELFYFDLDIRSELALQQETAFTLVSQDPSRLHFFSDEATPGVRARDFVEQAKDSYLGYSIIRPERVGRFGRSIVTPRVTLGGRVPVEIGERQIRTAVTEVVQLFGVQLLAVGVPFMEQDGALLRCAHVSAWICHYTAVLRGAVPRRTTGFFHSRSIGQGSVGRPYPSDGLSTPSLSTMLSEADLPPQVVDEYLLRQDRALTWADRPELIKQVSKPKKYSKEWKRAWTRENLADTICRYLNSAIPVILTRDSINHTQVVVGYLREEDLDKTLGDSRQSDTHSDMVAFIVADDTRGPYEIVYLDDLVAEILNESIAATSIVIPLPRALWMTGDAAEKVATERFAVYAQTRLEAIDKWPAVAGDHQLAKSLRVALTPFAKALAKPGSNQFTVRTYASPGTDFKYSFAKRVADEELVRQVGYTWLPKYVWVIEILDRHLRRQGREAVVATMVLDSTKVVFEDANETYRDVWPLFIHLPGQALAVPPYFGYYAETDQNEASWFVAPSEPYFSGRWSHKVLTDYPLQRIAGLAKTALGS
ncbi:hypothetical protein ASE16_02025 [Leifsonia sp. Root227]|uniref:hypothetical protein n=1 Tax=Leifsonia sp. Root227 TaxID=1736496 RepID=UPI0006F397BF|nr:hypothetical protein [Leifsonia sp. Root227]KRC51870.1 hypothetical protein ASE16_02025 [Leifsonia sp. Root227]